MKKPALLLAVLSLVAVTLTGCAGYRIGADKPSKMAHVTKLAVPTFKNDTLEPRLEVMVTNALIKKLQMDGAYQIVSVDEADAVLHATVQDIARNQFRAVRNNTLRSSELMVRLIVKFKVEDKTGETLLSGISQAGSNIVLDPNFQLGERGGLADAAERLSSSMASTLSEGW